MKKTLAALFLAFTALVARAQLSEGLKEAANESNAV